MAKSKISVRRELRQPDGFMKTVNAVQAYAKSHSKKVIATHYLPLPGLPGYQFKIFQPFINPAFIPGIRNELNQIFISGLGLFIFFQVFIAHSQQ